MEANKLVKDVMLPLSDYAVVEVDATILDAVRTLEEAQARLPPGRYLHRAVLVWQGDRIVGKLGHFAFLEALLRHRERMFDNPLIDAAGVSEEMVTTSMGHLSSLAGDLGGLCERSRHIRVGDVMRPATLRIDENASLLDATKLLVRAKTLSLLVTRGAQVVGVLRSADVFVEMTRVLKDCPPEED